MHTKCVKWLTIFLFLREPAGAPPRPAGCMLLRSNQRANPNLNFCCVFFDQLAKPGAFAGMNSVDQSLVVVLAEHCLVPDCRQPPCVTICIRVTRG